MTYGKLTENELIQYEQKWLNHVSRMEDVRYTHNSSLTIDLSDGEDMTTVVETTRRIQL